MQQDRLELICRVSDFSHPVSLIDSHGQMYAQCTFERNIQHCIPVSRNQSIVTYYSLKYVKFTTDGLTKDMNGEWVCLQDVMKSKTYVSLAKGIIDSTELEVHITGKYRNEKDNPRTIISCFSCTEPYGSNVEFLEDKISVDSLTFINDNDTCTHGKGVCHPDECNCTRNIYIRVSLYDTDSNEFHQMNKSTVTIKAGDKMWNETINSNKKIIIEQEEHPTITTPVAKTSDDIATDSEGGLQALEVISIIIACGVFSVFAVIFVHLYHKRRAMIPEGIEIGERKPLIESQNKSTIETQTEDNKKAIATMTEESFSLKVIQEEIVIEERKRFFDNKIAIATMTEESFLLQVIQEGTEIEEREPLFE
ncbi:uncharacterized protein LOC134683618 [Mytilus trossulus]|uniref:uncharacterized protein LOC134683618 n=1 Tax=Mytilus trossulus TaxID=6551 RepID=UPI0030064318